MMRSDRDWTIVQMLYRDPCAVYDTHPRGWEHRQEKYVVNDPLKSKAEVIVARWLEAHPEYAANLHEVNYYPRNYIVEARELCAAGRVIA
jgi:hypothetical protein